MSTINSLKSILNELNGNLRKNDSDYKSSLFATDYISLVKSLATIVMTEVTDNDLEYVTSLLLNRESGLVKFLTVHVHTNDKALVSAQATIIEFLISFIHKAKSILQSHLTTIEKCCIILFGSTSTRTQALSLDFLIEIIKNDKYLNTNSLENRKLYEKFKFELFLPNNKRSSTVKGKIMELLGIIAKYHPDQIEQNEGTHLLRTLTNNLTAELRKKESNNAILSGTLLGICYLITDEKFKVSAGSNEARSIYIPLKTVLNIPTDIVRFAPPLAALKVIIKHSSVFSSFLIQDYNEIYSYIQKMCDHQNRDLKKTAFRAMDRFLEQIGSTLSHTTSTEEKQIFKFFMQFFLTNLQRNPDEVGFDSLSLSIRGIGYFSTASKHLLNKEEMKYLQEQLIKKGNWLYSETNGSTETKISNSLPSFINAYTLFSQQYDEIPPSLLSILYKMVNIFVQKYNRFSLYTRTPGIYAIQSLIKTIFIKGEGYLHSFLNHFFYNLLVCTCRDNFIEKDPLINDEQHDHNELVYVWQSILINKYFQQDEEKNNSLSIILYDEFLKTVFRVIKSLNLDVRKVDHNNELNSENNANNTDNNNNNNNNNNNVDYVNTVAQNLKPLNNTDFILFHNLVEFWCVIVPQLDYQRLNSWIYTSSTTLIQDSLQKPLVSGFYRMLAVILEITDQLKLFDGYKKRHCNMDPQHYMRTNQDETYSIFNDYLHQLWHRMKQFKDELLASCLKLVLASPIEFFDIEQLINPLQTAIRFGLSYYPMITLALNTLETLFDPDSSSFSEVKNNPVLLNSLLPLFNDYLMKDMITQNDFEFQTAPNKYIIPNSSLRRTRKIHRKVTEKEMVGLDNDESQHIELYDIQLRIMRFLGRIGGLNKSLLYSNNSDLSLNDSTQNDKDQIRLTSWDAEQQLNIHIPFPNAGVQLPINELLPHICELSESSPDRKVKVASCELLHSLILLMIGNSAFQARDHRDSIPSRYHVLYKQIFPILLRLSIDLDQVTRDMFRSLIAQLIHWLTNNAQYESVETMILLQTCLDASCSSDAALRDYGVTCVFEFVKWSIKQTSAQSNRGPMNMKSLLKRLYHLALHPNSTKRLGSALIFNRIYRLYREEQTLVDEYTLELLYHFMFSLRLAENDHPSIGTQQQVKECISHLKRILRVKSSIFIHPSPNRRDFTGTSTTDLSSVIEWFFNEVVRYQRDYAKTCIEFFNEFVLVLPDIKDGYDWLQKKLNNDVDYLLELFEPTSLNPVSLPELNDHNFLSSIISFLRQLSCTIDGYTWLLERQILHTSTLLAQMKQPNSSFLNACIYLLKFNINKFNTKDASHMKKYPTLQRLYTYNSFRLICLLVTITENISEKEDYSSIIKSIDDTGLLNQPNIYKMVATYILSPHHTIGSIQSGQNLLVSWIETSRICSTAIHFLKNVQKYWPGSVLNQFCLAINKLLKSSNANLLLLDYTNRSIKDMKQAVNGIKKLQSVGLLGSVLEIQGGVDYHTLDEYFQALFNKFLEQKTNNDPAIINIVGELIQIPFSQPHFVELHGKKLLGFDDEMETDSDKERLTIYQNYSIYINKCMALNFCKYIPILTARINDDYIKHIIFGLLDYLKINKNEKKEESDTLCNDFLSTPEFLDVILKNWGNIDNYSKLVDLMKGIFIINLNILKSAGQKPIFNTMMVIFEHLLDESYPLSMKCDALDLLPFYLQLQGSDLDRVSKAIKSTINYQFPISFSIDNHDDKKYNASIVAFGKLLNTVSSFHSVTLFKLLIPIFMQDNGKVDQEMIKPAISSFASGLSLKSYLETVQKCFDYFKNTALSMKHRLKAVELVVSICTLVPYEYIISFYESNILFIMGVIKQEELRRGTDEEITIDLYEKASCFKLLQIMYKLLPVKQVHSPDSKISTIWEDHENKPSQGRKMTIDLVSQAHQAKNKKNPFENENLSEVRLKYQQAAYNAAAAAIHKTQKSEKFFVGFLFQEKIQEPLWENILDLSIKVNLQVEFNQPLLKIRLEDFRTRHSLKHQAAANEMSYMASIDLNSSSLSQDSLTDMAVEEYNHSNSQQLIKPDQLDFNMDLDQEVTEEGTTIRNESELELDQFNQNTCIKLLTIVIRRLHTSITPPNMISTAMPLWMNELYKSFNAPDASLVLQLYLAKLIINCPDIFEHYAQHWIRPLIKLAINGDKYGQAMNYYVQDLCVIIIAWGNFVAFEDTYNDRILLSKFMNYLISNAYHTDNRLIRNNIQIVKGVLDNWGKLIIIPTKILYQEITHNDPGSRRNLCGIQIIGAILAHGINIYYDGKEVDLNGLTEIGFYNALIKNISNKNRDVYAGAAEAVAWSLSLMKKGKFSNLVHDEIQERLINTVSKLDPVMYEHNDAAKYLMVLHRIQLHNNDICQPFIPKIYYLLMMISGPSQIQAVDIIAGCNDQPEEIFRELQSKGLLRIITTRNDESQLAILKLLNKIIDSISFKQIDYIFKDLIGTFQNHINNNCRDIYYKILQKIYDRLPEISSVRDSIKEQLFQGLDDSTGVIRSNISTYIQNKFGMTADVYERAKIILESMYMPSVENNFLSYSTQLLLDITRNSYEYDKPVFNEPLPNAHFDEHVQDINTSWKRNFTMVPLFTATQKQQQFNSEILENQLRQTQQTIEFSQTQQGASSLMSTFSNVSHSYEINPGLISSMEKLKTDDKDGLRQKQYAKLRRRYVKSTGESTTNFFIQRNEKLKKKLQHYQSLQKTARDKRVVMHRKYRIGELPDIQIKYSELVEPLKSLGRMDSFVARTLYTYLMVSIATNAEKNGSKENYIEGIINNIENNMKQSSLFHSPTIGSFLRIYYELGGSIMGSELIRNTSERSHNYHLGIAVLERQIERGGQESTERAPKRIKTKENKSLKTSIEEWIDLATLYQDIGEPEVFESLYRTYIASNDLPKKAVDSKVRGEIAEACNLFMESMETFHNEADPQEYHIWEKERLRCFEQLTQWDDVAFHVKNDLSDGYTELWDRNYQIPYLHYFLRSNIKLRDGMTDDNGELIPWTKENPNPIFPFLEQAIQSQEKLDYLLQHHGSEISLAAIYKKGYDNARYYIQKSYKYIQSTWTSLHPLANRSRLEKLAYLEKIVDIENFLTMVNHIQRDEITIDDLKQYIFALKSQYPESKLDGMDVWDDIIDSRMVFLDHLSKILKQQMADDIMDISLNCRKNLVMEMVSAAREQNNFNVAVDRWQKLLQLGEIELYQRNYALIQIELQRAITTDDYKMQSQMAARTLGLTLKYKLPESYESGPDFLIEFNLTAGKVFEVARIQLQNDPNTYQDFKTNKILAKQLEKRKFTNAISFANYMAQDGFSHFHNALSLSIENQSTLEADCLWKFGEYCDNILRLNENPNKQFPLTIDSVQYCKIIISNFFRAIDLGHLQAVEHFPRLLELIEQYPDSGKDFETNAEKYNITWYYIRWIPQLIAILDRPIAKHVFPIIYKLSQDYPSALYYPFHISNEHFECYKEQLDGFNRQSIEKIKNNIRSPIMETFVMELRRLTNPEHIVKDFIDFIMSVGQKVEINNTFLNDAYKQFQDLLLNINSSKLGSIPKAFAVKHSSQLRELLGTSGSQIRNLSDTQLKKLLKYYQANIHNQKLPGAAELLKSYSPWLSAFQSTNFKESIEVPGQYNGHTRPYPDSHIKIARFDDRLLVMGSLRKPKRLRIYGTDGREYMFLVKGGEDLRLDQRIQQLFKVINDSIRKEPYCAIHNVNNKTYNVIPMSTNVGMIEWVDNSKPLRNCIEEQLKNRSQLVRVQENYRIFVSKFRGDVMGYHNLFKASRDVVVKNFEQLTNVFQNNILKKYLIKLASSPEAFIFMRNNFAYSFAAINISGYILGIGDRHLENIMIDKRSGTLLAIDFGHAFGSATEILPVPELIPFRLTRQLVGALEPLGIKGILEVAMVHILEGIQQEKKVILNVMDVFVKEPLLDWKKNAAKQAKEQRRLGTSNEKSSSSDIFNEGSASSSSSSSSSILYDYEWYPQQKLNIAKKKLDGFNPTVILCEELERGHKGKSYVNHLEKVIKGDPNINIRAKINDQCANSVEQVQCLIDLATDPNILGRTWLGWQAFL